MAGDGTMLLDRAPDIYRISVTANPPRPRRVARSLCRTRPRLRPPIWRSLLAGRPSDVAACRLDWPAIRGRPGPSDRWPAPRTMTVAAARPVIAFRERRAAHVGQPPQKDRAWSMLVPSQ